MFYNLTAAVKRRVITELRRYWQHHPKYRDIVTNIQGSYSFKTRPQHGMVIKAGGGNQFTLSPDNFVGTGNSFLMLAGVGNSPGIAVEWVVEDAGAIANNGGLFPSPAGIYYIEITKDDEFYVDPLHEHRHEAVALAANVGVLRNKPLQGSVRLYEQPNNFELVEGTNYTVDYSNGGITLLTDLAPKHWLSADYRSPGTTTGPHKHHPYRTNHTAIPGCVLAFGDRAEVGDKLAVHVQPRRMPAYLEYGGRWDLSFDVDVFARDQHAQEELIDQTVIYLWGIARSRMSGEGIEMMELSIGGAAEEVYDENADDYFYNNSFSMTIQTEWHVRQPLTHMLKQVVDVTPAVTATLATDPASVSGTNLQAVENLNLRYLGDPYFMGKSRTFETIK